MIVEGINNSKRMRDYYKYIYEHVVKACVEAIENGDYSFAYNRYKRTVQLLENKFIAANYNYDINSIETIQNKEQIEKQI